MTKDDFEKVAALASDSELGGLLKELAQKSLTGASIQAAYYQGQTDAFRLIYDALCGQLPAQNDPTAEKQAGK